MHNQGNYASQIGRGPYTSQPSFQQNPSSASTPLPPPPPFHQIPLQPPFQPPRGGNLVYTHPLPGPPQHFSAQISYSYPHSEQQGFPWRQNVHQHPPMAPIPVPSRYPYQSSALMPQNSHLHALGRLPPPPPHPPPPPLPASPPPLPPSSPPLHDLSDNDEGQNLKDDVLCGGNLIPNNASLMSIAGDSIAEVKAVEAVAVHSPADSDIYMEDDIDLPDDEKHGALPESFTEGYTLISQELGTDNQLPARHHGAGDMLPQIADGGYTPFAGSSVSKGLVGTEVSLDSDVSVINGRCSKADDLSMKVTRETEQTMDANVKMSTSNPEEFTQPIVPVGAAETGDKKLFIQHSEGADAFKLLQGYATDNSTENHDENILGDTTTSSKVESRDFVSNNLEHSKSMIGSPSVLKDEKSSFKTTEVEDPADKSPENQEYVGREDKTSHKRDRNSKSAKSNVDKFGRIFREGGNHSDASISPSSTRKHARGRHSRSQSRSPSPRYRRKRSPWKRKERRGRSRSLSPVSRRGRSRSRSRTMSPVSRRGRSRSRSRTRSPVSRRGSEYVRDKSRPDNTQLGNCFDFRKGRCHRGSDCRYSHYESDKSDRSRSRSRSRTRSPVSRRGSECVRDKSRPDKTQLPVCFDFLRGRCHRGSDCRYSHHESDKSERSRSKSRSRTRSPVSRRGSESIIDKSRPDKTQLPVCFDFLRGRCFRGSDCRYSHHESDKSERSRYSSRSKHNSQDRPPTSQNADFDDDIKILSPKRSAYENKEMKAEEQMPPYDIHRLKDAKETLAYPMVHPYDKAPQIDQNCRKMDDSMTSVSFLRGTYLTSAKPDAEQKSAGQMRFVESPMGKPYTSEELPQFNHHLPSVSQATSIPVSQPIFHGYNPTPPSAPFYSKPDNNPSHQPNPHLSLPPHSLPSPFNLPPPPPRPTQTFLHTPSGLFNTQSTVPGQFQMGQYHPSTQQPYQAPDFRTSSLHVNNITNPPSVAHTVGEDSLDQGLNPLYPVARSQPNPLHGSLGGNVFPKPDSSHSQPYAQKCSYGIQYNTAGGVSSGTGEPRNLSSIASRVPFLGSSITNHFNPYASTFDQPLSSKFSSNASAQENDKPLNTTYGSSNLIPIGAQSTRSSPQAAGGDQYDPLFDSIDPPSNSFKEVEHHKEAPAESDNFTKFSESDALINENPKQGGHQNNEAPAESDNFTRFSESGVLIKENKRQGEGHQNNEAPADSDNFTRFSESGTLFIKENKKQGEDVALSVNGSLEIEEFGETADAEVGDVVNGSPSNPNDETDMHGGDIEIDQVKGSEKKSKESKAMKKFKNAIAGFVKEVLKPSWRQGNMSKEAFKTIVKKTVDKVSGAMKSHQIPRSQDKTNHYIDSSRGKLTRLVMGYVDKYVKM